MYDKESGVGKISFSKMELAEKMNMSYPTVARTTNELVKKEILSLEKIASGKQEMQFNFEKYNQGIVKVLLNHEERLDNTENEVKQLRNTVEELMKIVEANNLKIPVITL